MAVVCTDVDTSQEYLFDGYTLTQLQTAVNSSTIFDQNVSELHNLSSSDYGLLIAALVGIFIIVFLIRQIRQVIK